MATTIARTTTDMAVAKRDIVEVLGIIQHYLPVRSQLWSLLQDLQNSEAAKHNASFAETIRRLALALNQQAPVRRT